MLNECITASDHRTPAAARRLLVTAAPLVAAMLCNAAAVGQQRAQTINVSIAGAEHVEELGDPANTVLTVSLPTDAVVTGVGWQGSLSTAPKSWLSEADIALSDQGQSPGVIVTPGAGDDEPSEQGTFYTSNGIIPLGHLGLPGFRVSGTLAIEFAASFVAEPGIAQALWSVSSSLTIEYEIVDVVECPADIDGNGLVNVGDMLEMFTAWGTCANPRACPADLNGDGFVNVGDLLVLLTAWGPCPKGELTAACCMDDGSCQTLTEAQCSASGGVYQGNFTYCETWSCPQPPDGSSCSEALDVVVDGPAVIGDTTGNPAPPNAPICGQAGLPGNEGIVWYRVIGDGTQLHASTCGSPLFETVMAVYCGVTCEDASLGCVAGDMGSCDGFQSEVTWCSREDQEYFIAVWGVGDAGDVALTVNSGQPCSNAVECLRPCDGFCGGPAPSGCWCDELVCGTFGDCCEGVCQSCPELSPCSSGCGAISCPPGSLAENEPCGSDLNGGCNTSDTNPPMTAIACNETYCGTLWASGGVPDTDWYELDLSGESGSVQLTFTVESDVPVIAYLLSEGCTLVELGTDSGCSTVINECLAPGVYTLFVAPQAATGIPCATGPHQYSLTASCGSCGPGFSCAGICGQQAASGCWCDEGCATFEDCCPDVCDHCPVQFLCD